MSLVIFLVAWVVGGFFTARHMTRRIWREDKIDMADVAILPFLLWPFFLLGEVLKMLLRRNP